MTENPQVPQPEQPEQPSYQKQPPPPPSAYGQQVPGYGQPVQAPVSPVSPSDARMWSVFAHLGPILLSFLVPLIIYVVYKDRDPFIRRHAAQAMNFHITIAIIYIVSIPLMFVIIGIFTFIAAAICSVVFSIIAAVAANAGNEYTYPLTPKMIN